MLILCSEYMYINKSLDVVLLLKNQVPCMQQAPAITMQQMIIQKRINNFVIL